MSEEAPKRKSRRQDPVWKEDKQKNRKETKEAVELINDLRFEKGEEPLEADRDSSRRLVSTELDATKKELVKRNKELAEIREKLGSNDLKKGLELSREELSAMGITLKSNIGHGKLGSLSKEMREKVNTEIGSALLDKAMSIMNNMFDNMEALNNEPFHKRALALGIILDKARIFNGETATTSKVDVSVTHTVSDLISKSSQKKLGNLFSAEKDAEIIDVTTNKTNNSENIPDNDEDAENW